MITMFNGMNQAHWATETALLPEQKQVYGSNTGYDTKPEEPAANATTTQKATFIDYMNHHGVARSIILQGVERRTEVEYTVIDDAKTLWAKLASGYKSKVKLNMIEIREDL
jgi:hypothetical protein